MLQNEITPPTDGRVALSQGVIYPLLPGPLPRRLIIPLPAGRMQHMKINSCRVLIVDDHPMMREGMGAVINQQADMEVCGLAGSCPEALALAQQVRPDVALVDISLGSGSGFDLLKDLKRLLPKTVLLVVSMHDQTSYAVRSICAGAQGYVMKTEGPVRLISAIRQALQGELAVNEDIRQQLASQDMTAASGLAGPVASILSDRELEVFVWLGQGQSTREIAERLNLSVKTIETYRDRIKQKLGIPSATKLVQRAVQWVEKGI